MKQYDIVFIGHLGTGEIIPFQGSPFIERGGPPFFGPLAARCLTKKLAVITGIGENERQLLEPLKAAGFDLYIQSAEAVQFRGVFPTANFDDRQSFLIKRGGRFSADDVPPINPCLIHLGGLSVNEFSIEFMEELKERGFRLSVDMQSLVWKVDNQAGFIQLVDIPEKYKILHIVDFVKVDTMEAKALTGTDNIQDQANMLEDWGSKETVITRSDGALARSKGKTMFAKFNNRSTEGRMGRGDTFAGAYLARRLEHSVQDSLRFATALTSIKMESHGPFTGSLKEVIERMEGIACC